MSDIDWQLTAVAVSSPIAYIVVASFVYALVPDDWKPQNAFLEDSPEAILATVFWPLFFVSLFFYGLFMVGPLTVSWLRSRNCIPEARTVQR